MAAADGRGAAGGLDRGAAAAAAGRAAGLHLSAASVSALFTKQPSQVKLDTLAALCTALDCTPNDLIEVDTTPVTAAASPSGASSEPKAAAAGRCRRCDGYRTCVDCPAPVKFRDRTPRANAATAAPSARAQTALHRLRSTAAPGRPTAAARGVPRRSPTQAAQDERCGAVASSGATSGTACATGARWPTRTVRSATPLRWPAGWRRRRLVGPAGRVHRRPLPPRRDGRGPAGSRPAADQRPEQDAAPAAAGSPPR